MKNFLLFGCVFVLSCLTTFAQGTVDTDPTLKQGSGIDITSLLIGAAVGLVVGYLVGGKMAKK